MSRPRDQQVHMKAAGSQGSGEPALLAVGKLRHAHGVRGEMLMEVLTDFPERLKPGTALYLHQQAEPLRLLKTRPHNQGLLVTLEGYTTPEAVAQFRNQLVYVSADDRPMLDEGEFYHHQLIGLDVVTPAGEVLGVVDAIIETGASDVLVVRQAAREDILVPMVGEFVQQIDLAGRTIIVCLIPGMRPEEA